ncbi:MAG TPA: hypothetical protein VGR27_14415, partial [Longimicrobiaceae bacterium]|nr:hypothetical protein [Longimicrobiaceae bacterium]
IGHWGIEGAAIAWVARVSVDLLVLFGVVERILPASARTLRRNALLLGGAVLTLAVPALLISLTARVAFLVLAFGAFAPAAWFLVLTAEERALVLERGSTLRGGGLPAPSEPGESRQLLVK